MDLEVFEPALSDVYEDIVILSMYASLYNMLSYCSSAMNSSSAYGAKATSFDYLIYWPKIILTAGSV